MPTLDSGMIPKMEACLKAVEAGVNAAHVGAAVITTVTRPRRSLATRSATVAKVVAL